MDACAVLHEELTEDLPIEEVGLVRKISLAPLPLEPNPNSELLTLDEEEETTEVEPISVHHQDASRSFIAYESPLARVLKGFYQEGYTQLVLTEGEASLAGKKTVYQKNKLWFHCILLGMRKSVQTTWELPVSDSGFSAKWRQFKSFVQERENQPYSKVLSPHISRLFLRMKRRIRANLANPCGNQSLRGMVGRLRGGHRKP